MEPCTVQTLNLLNRDCLVSILRRLSIIDLCACSQVRVRVDTLHCCRVASQNHYLREAFIALRLHNQGTVLRGQPCSSDDSAGRALNSVRALLDLKGSVCSSVESTPTHEHTNTHTRRARVGCAVQLGATVRGAL